MEDDTVAYYQVKPETGQCPDPTRANARQIGGNHYLFLAIQPWDYNLANGLGFIEGNIVKYITRWREKGGIDDLRKARHFLDKLIEWETHHP